MVAAGLEQALRSGVTGQHAGLHGSASSQLTGHSLFAQEQQVSAQTQAVQFGVEVQRNLELAEIESVKADATDSHTPYLTDEEPALRRRQHRGQPSQMIDPRDGLAVTRYGAYRGVVAPAVEQLGIAQLCGSDL